MIGIFRDLDPDLWRQVNHNPVALLAALPPEQLVRRAVETVLDTRINFAFHRLERYLRDPGTWGQSMCGVLLARPVAYFSPEFALHESIPIYSGGLGALAGDHLKSASDLGVPLVGVGLFYGQGYFQQRIDAEGWQQEGYGHVDLERLPLRRAVGAGDQPVTVELPIDGRSLRVGAWRAQVGRATLLLLLPRPRLAPVDSVCLARAPAARMTAEYWQPAGSSYERSAFREMVRRSGSIQRTESHCCSWT